MIDELTVPEDMTVEATSADGATVTYTSPMATAVPAQPTATPVTPVVPPPVPPTQPPGR